MMEKTYEEINNTLEEILKKSSDAYDKVEVDDPRIKYNLEAIDTYVESLKSDISELYKGMNERIEELETNLIELVNEYEKERNRYQ